MECRGKIKKIIYSQIFSYWLLIGGVYVGSKRVVAILYSIIGVGFLAILGKAIVAIGRQDINMNTYSPFDSGIEVLGASSDHMILDVTDSKQKISVGSMIDFHINYEGLLSLSTSGYVHKVILREEGL